MRQTHLSERAGTRKGGIASRALEPLAVAFRGIRVGLVILSRVSAVGRGGSII